VAVTIPVLLSTLARLNLFSRLFFCPKPTITITSTGFTFLHRQYFFVEFGITFPAMFTDGLAPAPDLPGEPKAPFSSPG
jgi:hypothetical protein